MTRPDWFQLSFKFLGVYFFVWGLAGIGPAIQLMLIAPSSGFSFHGFGHLYSAAIQMTSGYLLLAKTGACLQKFGESPSSTQG